MYYCQEKHLIPYLLSERDALYMCPFGKQATLVDFSDISVESLSSEATLEKVKKSATDSCSKNCQLWEDIRNNTQIVDVVVNATKYIQSLSSGNSSNDTLIGELIGDACSTLLYAQAEANWIIKRDHMDHYWNMCEF